MVIRAESATFQPRQCIVFPGRCHHMEHVQQVALQLNLRSSCPKLHVRRGTHRTMQVTGTGSFQAHLPQQLCLLPLRLTMQGGVRSSYATRLTQEQTAALRWAQCWILLLFGFRTPQLGALRAARHSLHHQVGVLWMAVVGCCWHLLHV